MASASERITFSTTAGVGLRARGTLLPSYIKNVRRQIAALTIIFLIVALGGCSKGLHVATLQLGSRLNGDNTVATHTTRFKPDDRIYAAVLTDATGSSTIAARWTYNGQMVSEDKGAGATAFEFKSASGFPVGGYKVEILVDGQSVESRDFRVE
jgi:hypothetical protein